MIIDQLTSPFSFPPDCWGEQRGFKPNKRFTLFFVFVAKIGGVLGAQKNLLGGTDQALRLRVSLK